MPNFATMRTAVFKLFAKNRWGGGRIRPLQCTCLGLPETRLRLHSETSVFSAELHAIFLALQLMRQCNIQHACICSDSKSAVQSLMHINATDHAHLNILHLHEDLVDAGIEVQFLWLPGHSGISGNERADHYAKQALALPNISATPFDPNSIRRSIKYYCHRFQQLYIMGHRRRVWHALTSHQATPR